MKQRIKQAIENLKQLTASNLEELEQLRIQYLGKKGLLNELFAQFKNVPNEEKKEMGTLLNELKTSIQTKIESIKDSLEQKNEQQIQIDDLTKPSYLQTTGSRHPISLVRNEIVEIFSRIGYSVEEGPEIEDDWHVFSALNFPPEHPARDMQDTFFVEERTDGNNILLRTHTSSVQVRTMEKQQPPIRIIAPGRVFRNETISARAHCIFHQVEGLYIDKNVSFVDLKQSLLYFAREMFGKDTRIRLRPSYFPFTEPSAEMDISCNLCNGKGCNVCKGTGWLEIMGCGMVDPNVLEASNIDSKVYSGFAFGMGVERIAMLKYGINDLRLYFENDVRFLNQFKSII
ncbi:MAG TPA: phenylalanine--tRNA ligase subunit alpha [Candidatus Onthomorpha intestinigallinarum]|uniref:Phenylalanine--tRNA ligase alpha subunit n=1 Tax=Candidatus Onthomorpha intestinigallinarum TaxID=2840880 RepID=A0A9D1RFS2_9BACT|nr:phenylalanine--tRNA ligase subunit alpha [Candidatus Onthomorpha intestinigallinarum]